MNQQQAEQELDGSELVPCVEAPLNDAKRLRDACLDADIPALITSDPSCKSCGPKVQLMVRPPDIARVAALMRRDWVELAEREGTLPVPQAAGPDGEPDGEPPCPACGNSQPLVEGACAECGLTLG